MKRIKILSVLVATFCLIAMSFSQKPGLIVQKGFAQPILAAAFSPDGKYALLGSKKEFKMWDLATWKEIRTVAGPNSDVTVVAVSRDAKHALWGCLDGSLHLWDVSDGQEVRSFSEFGGYFCAIAVLPDGKHVLSSTSNEMLQLWDISEGRVVRLFKGHHDNVSALAVSPDGRYAVSGGYNLKLWNISNGVEILTLTGHLSPVSSIAFSPDGKYILSASRDKTLRLWDASNGQVIRTFTGHTGSVSSIAFSSDGNYVFSGSHDKSLMLWDAYNGRVIRTFTGHEAYIFSVSVSSDGKYALSGSSDGTFKLWDISKGVEVHSLGGDDGILVSAVAFSPDGKYTLSGSSDGTFKIWGVSNGEDVRSFGGHRDVIWSVAVSPDGKYAVSGSDDKLLKIWDVVSGLVVRTLTGHKDAVRSVAISRDGKYVLSGSYDRTLKLWNASNGRLVRSFIGHKDGILSVAISPDGKYALSGSHDKSLKLWDISTGRVVRTFNGHHDPVSSVTFSSDGRFALSGSSDWTLKLWDVSNGRVIHTFEGHEDNIWSVVLSSDGKHALSGSKDGTLKLWDVSNGQEVRTFTGHKGAVLTISISPDGKYVASGSVDQTMRIWRIANGEEITKLIPLDSFDWAVVTPDGRFDASSGGMKALHFVQGMQVLPLESFFDKFFTPGLLAKVMSGTLPPLKGDQIDFSKEIKLPPLVQILSPQSGNTFTTQNIDVKVQVTDQSGGIDEIVLYQNNTPVGGESKGAKSTTFVKVYPITLVSGKNTIRATAYNKDRTESIPAEIVIELSAPKPTATLFMIAIGIDQYANPNYHLRFAKADADGFAQAIQKRGGGIFQDIVLTKLYDQDATKQKVFAAFDEIGRNATREDVFVFYYSGHGVISDSEGVGTEDFYFMLHDVERPYGTDELVQKGISAMQFRELCGKVRAQKKLVVLDACHTGSALDAFASLKGSVEEKAIWQLARRTGVFVLAASGKDQTAKEVPSLGHGIFTYTLLQALNCIPEVVGPDGLVYIKALERYVDTNMEELTRQHHLTAQRPMSWTFREDFPVAVCK